MQAKDDIFSLWPSISAMADDLGRGYDTVLAWRSRKRIPEDAWPDVIDAAAKRGHTITAGDIFERNAAPKKRGWPRKVRKIRPKRAEARVG